MTAAPPPGAAPEPWATLPGPLLMPFPRPTVILLDLWKEMLFTKSQYQDFSDHLVKIHTRVSVQRTQPPHSHQIVLYEKNIMNEARKTRKKSYTEGSAVRK